MLIYIYVYKVCLGKKSSSSLYAWLHMCKSCLEKNLNIMKYKIDHIYELILYFIHTGMPYIKNLKYNVKYLY